MCHRKFTAHPVSGFSSAAVCSNISSTASSFQLINESIKRDPVGALSHGNGLDLLFFYGFRIRGERMSVHLKPT